MNDALIPILASILTLLLTKVFDVFMAKKKESIDRISLTLTAADEVADAAATTIGYLRQELSESRIREAEILKRESEHMKYISALELQKERLEKELLSCKEKHLRTV